MTSLGVRWRSSGLEITPPRFIRMGCELAIIGAQTAHTASTPIQISPERARICLSTDERTCRASDLGGTSGRASARAGACAREYAASVITHPRIRHRIEDVAQKLCQQADDPADERDREHDLAVAKLHALHFE